MIRQGFSQGYANINTIYLRLNKVNCTYHKYEALEQRMIEALNRIFMVEYKMTFSHRLTPGEEKFIDNVCKFTNKFMEGIEFEHPAKLAEIVLKTLEV